MLREIVFLQACRVGTNAGNTCGPAQISPHVSEVDWTKLLLQQIVSKPWFPKKPHPTSLRTIMDTLCERAYLHACGLARFITKISSICSTPPQDLSVASLW